MTLIRYRKAYFKLAKTHHPDVSKDSETAKKFEKINEAYQTLKNPEARKLYDRTGLNADEQKSAFQGWQVNEEYTFEQKKEYVT